MAKQISEYGLSPSFSEDMNEVTITLFKRERDDKGEFTGAKATVGKRTYKVSDLSEAMQRRHTAQSVSTTMQQRVSQDDPKDKLDGMDQVWEAWCDDEWKRERTVGPRILKADVPLIEYLADKKKATYGQVAESFLAYTEEQQEGLRQKHGEAAAAFAETRSKPVDLLAD